MTPITEPSNICGPLPSRAPLPLPSLAPLSLLSPTSKPRPKRSSKPRPPPSSSPSREESFQKWWEFKPDLSSAIRELADIRGDRDRLNDKRGPTKTQLFKAQSTLRCLRALRSREGSLTAHSEKELIYGYIKLKKRLGPEKWERLKEKWRAIERREKEEQKRRLKAGGKPDLTNLDRTSLGDAIHWYRHEVHKLEHSLQTMAKSTRKTAVWEEAWLGKVSLTDSSSFPPSLSPSPAKSDSLDRSRQ